MLFGAKGGMLDTPIAGQYKAKETFTHKRNLGRRVKIILLARPLEEPPASPCKLVDNDAVVHGLNLADDMEIRRAGMAPKQRC